MNVELLNPSQLDPHHRQLWRTWQSAVPGLDSPFVCPEFAVAVAAVRPQVRIAKVLDQGGQPAAFFAFEQHGRVARPLAAALSEWEGVVARPGFSWNARQLLQALQLRSLSFEHVPLQQQELSCFAHRRGTSPSAFLHGDFASYRAQQLQSSGTATQIERKWRKLQRERGSVRFELTADVQQVLDCLARWKRRQHERTSVMDVFQFAWVRQLLETLATTTHGADFLALPSLLYCGQTPIAVHFGISTRSVAHVWFPAYDEQYAAYSPGLILFWELFRELSARGIQRVDFGPSPQRYKQSLANGHIPVSLGAVYAAPLLQQARKILLAAKSQLRSGIVGQTLRFPAHALFRFRQWRAFR